MHINIPEAVTPPQYDSLLEELAVKTANVNCVYTKATDSITINDNPPATVMTKHFGETVTELARKDERIVGITPAMASGCSLNIMMKEFPERTFDVGIAEQHAVTFSAGLAAGGMLPFCNIYSTFMQRAYDSIVHDVALQNLKVVFCIDRGGLVGEDGATHHGAFDMAYFRSIPNIAVAAPLNEVELRNMLYSATLPEYGAVAIRYPRGECEGLDWKKDFEEKYLESI